MRKCVVCPKKFRPRKPEQRCCSLSCSMADVRTRNPEGSLFHQRGLEARKRNNFARRIAAIKEQIERLPPEHNVPEVRRVLVDVAKRCDWMGYQRGWLQRTRAERKSA